MYINGQQNLQTECWATLHLIEKIPISSFWFDEQNGLENKTPLPDSMSQKKS